VELQLVREGQVNQLGVRHSVGWLAAVMFVRCFAGWAAIAQSASTATSGLNPENPTRLHQALDSSNSADFRWPHFIDYSQHIVNPKHLDFALDEESKPAQAPSTSDCGQVVFP
jgi:hypothetical protein